MPPTRAERAAVIHLQRIRAAVAILAGRRGLDPAAGGHRQRRPVNTALAVLQDHAAQLPRRHRQLLRQVVDPRSPPWVRAHALRQLADCLRVTPAEHPLSPSGRAGAQVVPHPRHQRCEQLVLPGT
ncbi:MAG TPA: hypothetical protein VE575_11395 [Acidimicrobiales bacterium]|nr:hypothetical protein [Acidimicrobiales bacterium]